MNVQEIIKLAKYKTNTSDNQSNYDQQVILPQLNMVYKKIYRKLATGVGKYFWQSWVSDVIEHQNEYTLDFRDNLGMWKILGVELNKNKLSEITEVDRTEGKSGYMLKDNSIFIYPVPKSNINGGLHVIGIQTIPDLALEDEEDKIFAGHPQLRDIHEVLVSGLMVELREGKSDFDRADRERAKFLQLLQEVEEDLLNRNPSIEYSSLEY